MVNGPLLKGRYGHVVLVRNDCIYVYGGANHYSIALKPDCYNINTKAWSYIDTDVFNDVILNNCVYNEHVVYLSSKNNIYSICLYDNIKTLLYTNVKVLDNCLVLMNLNIKYIDSCLSFAS